MYQAHHAARRLRLKPISAAVLALLSVSAHALPSAPTVAAGSASVVTAGPGQMTVNQQSQNAVINWLSFGIGAGESVRFAQPNNSSIALNRVVGSEASRIQGQLTGNGQVWLLNPNGVLFGSSAQVSVGGLVASTLDISDADFLAGRRTFSGTGGTVTNQGSINAGYAALLGGQVSNEGTIVARLGTVALAAGNQVTLDFNGDQLLNVQVDRGTLDALAKNSQLVRADGGTVIMTAKAADALTSAVVNNTGVIEARTLENRGGVIKLLGDMQSGTTLVAGTLDASAPSGGDGGFIETSAQHVRVAEGTRVSTLAPQGAGGTWLVDPTDFTVSAGAAAQTASGIGADTLAANLATTSVTLQTAAAGSEPGDIHVNAAVRWNAATTLTLNAANHIDINAPITVQHAGGGLALNHGGTNGNAAATPAAGSDYRINAPISFTAGSGGSFSVNGQSYTLLRSMSDVQGINANLGGRYALATDLNAGGTAYLGALVANGSFAAFTGRFTGLGHAIDGLNITAVNDSGTGLFRVIGSGGEVRDLGLTSVSVSGNGWSVVGALAGVNQGTVSNLYASGGVSGGLLVGGLVGRNYGTIRNAHATGTVSGSQYMIGGLVGVNDGTISDAYADASVTGDWQVGGLVGNNNGGSVSNAHATGRVTGRTIAGGLVGYNIGTISNAFASGSASANNDAGGLVGYNDGAISNVFATGSVSATNGAGGLVGSNGGAISNAYATGSAVGDAHVGGLVGYNSGNGTISNAYAIGGAAGNYGVGGLAGLNEGTISNAYWLTDIAGSGVGSGSASGLTGLSTAQLIASLPTGFDPTVWGNQSNQTSPYLLGTLGPVFVTGQGHALFTPVTTMAQLRAINGNLGGNYALFNDIVAAGTVYSGALVGDYSRPFTGRFTGLGHTIGGLTIQGVNTLGTGLFGAIGANGLVRDLGLTSASVTGGNNFNIGALAGLNYGTISNAYASGSVSGSYYVGGLVGFNDGGTIGNAYASSSVLGTGDAIGGLVGLSNNGGQIRDAYATGNVSGSYYVGGLVGRQEAGTVSNVYATGRVTGDTDVGGLAGFNTATISNAYATGGVSGRTAVGGLVGLNYGSISKAYATGSTSGPGWVGGLAGSNDGTISDAYWNTTTSGATTGVGSGTGAGVTGRTTAELANALPTGFDSATWGNGDNQTTPYLLSHASFATTSGSVVLGSDTRATPAAQSVILTATQLQNMNANLAGRYVLGANIDASATAGWNGGLGFAPVGNFFGTSFSGTFNGLGHTISGLTIARGGQDSVGLFGSVASAGTVSNLGLVGGSVSGKDLVGGLVGVNSGTIKNVYATGSVVGNLHVGGLAGGNLGTISNAFATGSVSGTQSGGLVGTNQNGTVTNTYATGNVSGTFAGGLVGANINSNSKISNSYATGQVTGSNAGGLVGTNAGTISNAYWDTTTSGTSIGVGSGSDAGATGLDTAAMQQLASFTGWSIDDAGGTGSTWRIYEGHTYPLLRSFLAPMTVTAADARKTYDGLSFSGGSLSYSSAPSANLFGPTTSSNAAVNAGSYTLDPGVWSNQLGYDISIVKGTLTIDPATLTVTANNASKAYDGQAYSGGAGVSYSGFVNGEDESVLGGTLSYGGTSQGATNAGSYTISASGLTSGNYAIGYTDGALTVNKAALAVTANNAAKTYDGQAFSGGNGVSYSGFVNGETESVLGGTVSYGGTAQGATNAGSYTISASGLTSGNYAIGYTDGALTVNKAALTVSANDAAKTYDGQAYSGGNGVSYSGFVNGETDSVLGGTVSYGGTSQGATNAGSYTISASGLTSGNYAIGYANGALTVNKAALTVTANDAAKTYDGQAYSGGNGVSYSGFVNGETDSVLGGALSYGGTSQGAVNAGSYTITASGLTSGNYAIGYTDGALTVNKAALTVSANDAAKTYDGLAYSGGSGVSYSGFVNGETDSVLGGTVSYGGTSQGATNAGSYTITASGLTSGNYAIGYANGALTVNKAALTVTANNAAKTYDGLAFSGGNGVSYSGFVNGETDSVLGGTLNYGGSAQGATNTGSYTISASGLTSGNYAIGYTDGALTVNKAALTVAANNAVKTYDGQAYSGGNGVSYSGFVNGETAAVLGGTLGYGGSAQGATNAGSYTISASGLTSGNYAIGYTDGALTVNKAALTVTANNAAKTYNGQAYSGGNGVSYSGFVNGETAAVLGGTLSYGGSAQGATNAGSYTISASGLTSGNYAIGYTDGALTVNKAALTVSANDAAKTYDGLAFSGGNGVSYSGFVNGETDSVLGGTLSYGGTSQGATNAGSYTIAASGLTSGNYAIGYTDGALTVNKAALTVTANDAAKTYDGLAYSGGNGIAYTGFVNGETSAVLGGSLTYAGSAQNAVDLGRYVITPAGLTSSNYTIAYVDGALAITLPAVPTPQDAYLGAVASAHSVATRHQPPRYGNQQPELQIVDCGQQLPASIAHQNCQ